MIPITLPRLSLAMEEGKIARWLVEDGAVVTVGQSIAEIETDKAITELEAPASGAIHRIVPEGAVVSVEAVLAQILEDGESLVPNAEAAPTETANENSLTARSPRTTASVTSVGGRDAHGDKHSASPAARRLAKERGINLSGVRGTGPEGRITVDDLNQTQSLGKTTLRDAVVEHIAASWNEIPHIHIGGELDGSGLAKTKRAAAPGVTITDLLVVAVVGALREVPELNGSMGKLSTRVDLALAVSTDHGVVAPVVRRADSLSLSEIAQARAKLVMAARAGTLDGRDLAGGTITMSNLGMYPVDFFAPVVSGPQIAMLAVGRLAERPFATNGTVGTRQRIWVNVAIDHRAADGVSGARFLAAMEHYLNAPTG
jgi:pyruvate dehydrogenase E2 component (dihydrolipoamide acetyltransferase)